MPSLIGTPVVSPFNAIATSFVVSLPANIESGELLLICSVIGEITKSLSATGWTVLDVDLPTSSRVILWKEASGSEGATVTVNVETIGTTAAQFISCRMTGVDTTDPFNSNNFYSAASAVTSSPTITAGALTIAANNGILAMLSCEATRDVTTFDADLDAEVGSSATAISNHVYLDQLESTTGSPEYAFTMSDSRAYDLFLLELKASGGGGGIEIFRRRINGY